MVASRSDASDTLQLAVSGAASRLPGASRGPQSGSEGTTDAGTSRDSGFELPIAVATGQPILSPAEERREGEGCIYSDRWLDQRVSFKAGSAWHSPRGRARKTSRPPGGFGILHPAVKIADPSGLPCGPP
jgi:hypothetical protein